MLNLVTFEWWIYRHFSYCW